ncbi:MAG TPA: phytanoyl-CoA dioxygenase family protein [Deltaproteobacteria bacterium]|nr:phytanoyl-CoA dioxygenase family protein [Deltaproteobacteria bacterium]
MFNQEQIKAYQRDGFLLINKLFDQEEIGLLSSAAKQDHELERRSRRKRDSQGGTVRLSLWNHPGDTIYGMFARCHRIVNSMEVLLDGEVYHYHSKMILKDPEIGGAWEWHQDYGYWYQNGCLQPLLASVMIAVDPATRENGCLQVLRQSHHLGRLDHQQTGDQAGADMERVEEAMKIFDRVYVEMKPGDALFFHCNLLHRSNQNRSPNSRWSLICCYNAARNNPYKESHHPCYTPLQKVPDAAIKEIGTKRFDEHSDVGWMGAQDDRSAVSLKNSNSLPTA